MSNAEAIRRDRARRRDDAITYWLVMASMTLMGGWTFMLAVGVVRADWIRACPTVDFGTSILLAMLVRTALLLPTARKGKD